MPKRVGLPINSNPNYCEIVEILDTDGVPATTVVNYKFVMDVINHAMTKETKNHTQIEFSVFNAGFLGMRFRDTKTETLLPEGKHRSYAIAPVFGAEMFKQNSPKPTGEVERELRADIAKLEKEIYRLKAWGKVHPSGIEDMEHEVKKLYQRVSGGIVA
jgi:hypothetical protein